MHNNVLQFFDFLNTIILIYFLVANAIYTVLMVLSLYAVSIHSRFADATASEPSRTSSCSSPAGMPAKLGGAKVTRCPGPDKSGRMMGERS